MRNSPINQLHAYTSKVNTELSPFSTTRICSRDAKQKQKSAIVIGQQKKPLHKAFFLTNHVAEFVVHANKFA